MDVQVKGLLPTVVNVCETIIAAAEHPFAAPVPFDGITRIRFYGYNLSPLFWGTPDKISGAKLRRRPLGCAV
jgi:hypothetical protein